MAQKQYYGPLWPMNKITVPTAGVGVVVTTGQTSLETTEYYEAIAKGILVSAPTDNSGDVYLVVKASDGTFRRTNDGTVVAVISPGSSFPLPSAEYSSNLYKLSDFGIDVDSNGDIAYVCAIMQ